MELLVFDWNTCNLLAVSRQMSLQNLFKNKVTDEQHAYKSYSIKTGFDVK